MGFGKGRESNAVASFKRYYGVGLFKVAGVNLTNAELSELYGHEVSGEERQFVREVDIDGVKTKRVDLNFTLYTMIDDKPEYFNARYSLFEAPRIGATSGKAMVMDEYGRTAWATEEEFNNHAVPQYKSGPANITVNYRGIYRGEDLLTRNDGSDLGFLTAFMNIPNVTKFKDGVACGLIDAPEDALCRLEHPEKLFDGDFSEIREALKVWPNNELKLLAGVRTDDQNRQWQDFFVEFPMRASTRKYEKLQDALDNAKANGRYGNTVFGEMVGGKELVGDFKVYEDAPTGIPASAAPTAAPTSPAAPWFKKPNA